MPAELRTRAAAWIAQQRVEGRTVAELAAELGVADGTVIRWSNRVRAIVPVQVVPDESPAQLVVVSPAGLRVEGLSLAEAIQVLRELG
jgi:hypothetical protein